MGCPRCGGLLLRDESDAICLCGYRHTIVTLADLEADRSHWEGAEDDGDGLHYRRYEISATAALRLALADGGEHLATEVIDALCVKYGYRRVTVSSAASHIGVVRTRGGNASTWRLITERVSG